MERQYREKTILLCVAALCMFLSVSCSVLNSADEHAVAGDGQCSLTVSCSYSSARSAFPSGLPTAGVYYFAMISYENGGTRYLGKSSAALESPECLSNSGTVASPCFLFAAPVYSGQYTITLYLCSTEIFALANCGAKGTATLPLDKGQRSYSSTLPVALSPITSGSTGTGTVSLSYSWSLSTVTGGSVTVTNSAGENPSGLKLTSDDYTTGATLSGTLAAGTYTVVLSLSASGTNVPLSNPVQIITVYAGFTTDKWYDADGTAVDALSVTNTVQTVFYVCGASPSVYGISIASGTYTTADTNSGTMLAPFATVPAAVNKIIAANDGASTYYIYIDGTCTDSSSDSYTALNNSAYINISPNNSLTLVIQPFGSAQATINADRDSTKTGRVLYVSGSSVNLTLKNVKLTGGYASGSGGGVYLNSGTVTLSGGTLITGNAATTNGGGVYVADGTFAMQGSAVVTPTGTGANSVYLATGKSITVSGTLTAAAAAAILAADCPEKGGTADVLTGTTVYTLTAADCSKFSAYSTGTPVPAKNIFTGYIYLSSSTVPGTGAMIGFGTAIPIATGTVTIESDKTWSSTKNYALPTTIHAFSMGQFEVTYALWYAVKTWAVSNGYTFGNPGSAGNNSTIGATPDADTKYQPVYNINWRDAIVWCNALSEMTGKTRVYYTDGDYTSPLKVSTTDTTSQTTTPGTQDDPYIYSTSKGNSNMASCTANGYRLPTEAEWEYAARGGDTTDTTNWNYTYSGGDTAEDVAWTVSNTISGHTGTVGTKPYNKLGMYDMSGNVSEWTWNVLSSVDNTGHVLRGGSTSTDCFVSSRVNSSPFYNNCGFRVCFSN